MTNNDKQRKGMDKMLSIDTVADILGLPKATIYKYVSEKKILAYKFGKHLRFKQEDLEKFIRDHKKE